jgi:hypothetical protein
LKKLRLKGLVLVADDSGFAEHREVHAAGAEAQIGDLPPGARLPQWLAVLTSTTWPANGHRLCGTPSCGCGNGWLSRTCHGAAGAVLAPAWACPNRGQTAAAPLSTVMAVNQHRRYAFLVQGRWP